MSRHVASRLNLASRPFRNVRPLVRLCVLLWSVALALIVINGALFWRYQSGSSEGRAQLQRLRAEAAGEVALVEDLQQRLGAFDLEEQNQQVEFLNQRILERTFPWSRLFDELVETMPREVRLKSLLPRQEDRRSRRGSRARRRQSEGDGSWIQLGIEGEAASGEALLDFYQRLFEHPAFGQPSLLSEERQSPQLVRFSLQARYRAHPPSASQPPPELEPATETEAETGGEVTAESGDVTPGSLLDPGSRVAVVQATAEGSP